MRSTLKVHQEFCQSELGVCLDEYQGDYVHAEVLSKFGCPHVVPSISMLMDQEKTEPCSLDKYPIVMLLLPVKVYT